MDDDLVPISTRVVSRQLMQTHEALNIRVVLVQHARETGQESAINTCEILGSELRLYIKVGVVNVHRQESRPSTLERAAKHQGSDGCDPEESPVGLKFDCPSPLLTQFACTETMQRALL